ncbi:hypothetical protein A3Q56_02949 [Intoshia linei]|uniref:GRIP domain-containing protein n=1 Tax=Intoshia linei TaxID=1819745 RepID=A0A177B4X3_9BILA|nr:hypothetical protein A3Q56_02949 [Intoshia linei]
MFKNLKDQIESKINSIETKPVKERIVKPNEFNHNLSAKTDYSDKKNDENSTQNTDNCVNTSPSSDDLISNNEVNIKRIESFKLLRLLKEIYKNVNIIKRDENKFENELDEITKTLKIMKATIEHMDNVAEKKSEIVDQKLNSLNYEIEFLKSESVSNNKSLTISKNDNEKLNSQVSELKKNISQTLQNIKIMETNKENINLKNSKLQQNLDSTIIEKEHYHTSCNILQTTLADLRKYINLYIFERLKKLWKEIFFKSCYTHISHQSISQANSNYKLQINQLSAEVEQMRDKTKQMSESNLSTIRRKQSHIDDLLIEIKSIKTEKDKVVNEIKNLKTSLSKKSQQDWATEKKQLCDEISKNEIIIRSLTTKMNELQKLFHEELKSQMSYSSLKVHNTVENINSLDEYTNHNFEYLKHVSLKFFMSREDEALKLMKVMTFLLKLTKHEEQLLISTIKWRMSWFGGKPRLGLGQSKLVIDL